MPPSFSLMNWTAAWAPSPTSGNVPPASPSRFGRPMTNGSRLSSAASGDDSAASIAAAHSSAPSPSSPTGGPPPPPAVSSGASVSPVSASVASVSVASVSASVASVSASVASVPASVASVSASVPAAPVPPSSSSPHDAAIERGATHDAQQPDSAMSPHTRNPFVTAARGGPSAPPLGRCGKCRRETGPRSNLVKSPDKESTCPVQCEPERLPLVTIVSIQRWRFWLPPSLRPNRKWPSGMALRPRLILNPVAKSSSPVTCA